MGVDFIGRKLGFVLLLAAVALPVSAANPLDFRLRERFRRCRGSTRGDPWPPWVSRRSTTAFTDARGCFSISDLGAGLYDVKVSAPSFLPTLREELAPRGRDGY